MNPRGLRNVMACLVAATATLPQAIGAQHAVRQAIDGRPDAIIDLRSGPGVELVRGEWRYSDARIVDVQSRAAGADLRASGDPVKALDVAPQAGSREFDDSSWQRIVPASLEARHSWLMRSSLADFNWITSQRSTFIMRPSSETITLRKRSRSPLAAFAPCRAS